jgi:integrase
VFPGQRVQEPIEGVADCYLAYQRSTRMGGGGTWKLVCEKPNHMEKLGLADDCVDADGVLVLTYQQAKERAKARNAVIRHCVADCEPIKKGGFTVQDALDAYFLDGEQRGMKSLIKQRQSAGAWITPVLGAVEVAKLTRRRIETWLAEMAESPKRIRAKVGQGAAFAAAPSTNDEKRARRDSANRVLTILKAALNFALDRRLIDDGNMAWRAVKAFRGVTSQRKRYLQPNEAIRLINVCEGDFKDLVRGALATGARYGELVRLKCCDYDRAARTLFIAESKNGKQRHIVLDDVALTLFDGLIAKRKGPDSLIFENGKRRRSRGGSLGWLTSDQSRLIKRACEVAGLEPISFHELRHTYASFLVNTGCPLVYVAEQLGHSDTRMVEKHYGHLAPNAKADAIRRAMPNLGVDVDTAKVEPLQLKGRLG